jgi:predicted  nucleic acid-binding Zn-ribbon protein
VLVDRTNLGDGYTSREIERVVTSLVDASDAAQNSQVYNDGVVEDLRQEVSKLENVAESNRVEIESLTKARDKFKNSAETDSSALQELRQRFDDLVIENQKFADVHSENHDLKARLQTAEAAVKEAATRYQELESASGADEVVLADLRTSARQDAQKIIDLSNEKAEVEKQREDLRTELDELRDDHSNLEERWDEALKSESGNLREKYDDLEQKAQNCETKLQESNSNWLRTLTSVLTSKISGEDIPSSLLQPILQENFSSMDRFSPKALAEYTFAERYSGLSQLSKEDLSITELLCWSKGISTPSGVGTNELDQIVWLESFLLEHIRSRQKKDTWVLLAFELLLRIVKSENWLARCVACVRLAVLGNQYVMYDGEAWIQIVNAVRIAYPQLDVDPLGQACVAYLALTTDDSKSFMKPNLAQASFGKMTRIPEILALLKDDNQVASTTVGKTRVVVASHTDQEVVFSRTSQDDRWKCSVRPTIELHPLRNGNLRLTWGRDPEDTVEFDFDDPLYRYLRRHHGNTALPTVHNDLQQRVQQISSRMTNAPMPRY